MLFCFIDSLRRDAALKELKGIFGSSETWTKSKSVETYTAPCMASIATGQPPEKTGVVLFTDSVNPEACKNTLFDNFSSWVTTSRLAGNTPKWMPPSRRNQKKFLPPIKWNAVTNAELGGLEYISRKYSITCPEWNDFIFYHAWSCHGPWGIPEYGPKEIPCIKNCDRLMRRMSREELWRWYMIGVKDFKAILNAIRDVTNNKELIVLTNDHGEELKDTPEGITGHVAGRGDIEVMSIGPFWVNRPNVDLPELVHQEDMKDLLIELYKQYEVEDESYQDFKKYKLDLISKFK